MNSCFIINLKLRLSAEPVARRRLPDQVAAVALNIASQAVRSWDMPVMYMYYDVL